MRSSNEPVRAAVRSSIRWVRESMALPMETEWESSASVSLAMRLSTPALSSAARASSVRDMAPVWSSKVRARRLALSSSELMKSVVRLSTSDTKLSVRSPKELVSVLPAVSRARVRLPPLSTMVPEMRWLIMSRSKTRPVWLSVIASRTRSVLVSTLSRWLASSAISARMRDSLSE
ncbi:hypothetical protein D3C87_1634730 [compost metagenome]